MDCSPPGSSVHGILQASILEWVAMPSSKIFLTLGLDPDLLCLLHWQAGSLPLSHLWSSFIMFLCNSYLKLAFLLSLPYFTSISSRYCFLATSFWKETGSFKLTLKPGDACYWPLDALRSCLDSLILTQILWVILSPWFKHMSTFLSTFLQLCS